MLLQIRDILIDGIGDGGVAKRIVHGVSLELQRGEVLGLIGESGAGKSTIGLAALGYARHGCRFAGGSVVLDGMEVLGLGEHELLALRGRRVAYVAQSAAASFNPAKTLDAQITESAVRHGVMSAGDALDAARTLYRELLLPDPDRIGRRYPHQVSGGQLQRAMVAMAMICRPDLIVFDEPTTALDVTTQVEVLAAIKKVIESHGTAALYITHDLAVVAQVAHRIMVLRYGRMVEVGEAGQILAAPKEDYTRALVAARLDHPKPGRETPLPLLSVRAMAAAYAGGSLPVLNGINLDLAQGHTLAVVGESGSGKSTLARVVTGLLPPVQGRLMMAGHNLAPALASRTKDEKRRLQMVHQMPDVALNPRQTIGAILGRPLSFYFSQTAEERERRVAELLRLIDLPENFAGRYPAELSGGQKQRICIARALAAEPELIILDEVTSALDPLVADGILELLERLQRETGVAYLMITHDLGVVRNHADEVLVLQRGEIVEQGTVEEVFNPPHHPYTEKLLASVPELRPGWLDEMLTARKVTTEAAA